MWPLLRLKRRQQQNKNLWGLGKSKLLLQQPLLPLLQYRQQLQYQWLLASWPAPPRSDAMASNAPAATTFMFVGSSFDGPPA